MPYLIGQSNRAAGEVQNTGELMRDLQRAMVSAKSIDDEEIRAAIDIVRMAVVEVMRTEDGSIGETYPQLTAALASLENRCNELQLDVIHGAAPVADEHKVC